MSKYIYSLTDVFGADRELGELLHELLALHQDVLSINFFQDLDIRSVYEYGRLTGLARS